MRLVVTLTFILISVQVFSQACKMPETLDLIRPERCGIRYVQAEGQQINVILEFEKKARIITPDNPNDVKGIQANLIGLYYLTYDRNGEILRENKVFVQTGDLPPRGIVFGLNGQRGEMLETDLQLISVEEYEKVPWGGATRSNPGKPVGKSESGVYFETALNVDKAFKITDLQIAKWDRGSADRDSLPLYRKRASLINYDSCTKKRYWTNQYLPSTDAAEGFTLALLNLFDRDVQKEISEKSLRLVSFDTNGQVAGSHEMEFESPMDIVYRNEVYKDLPGGGEELDKQIWVMKTRGNSNDAHRLSQYYYYSFDKKAQLQTSAIVVSKHQIFDPINVFWQEGGVFYMSNTGHEIVSLYLENSGKYHINSSGERLKGLRDFMLSRGENRSQKITFGLHQPPTVFDNGNLLMIYRVQENVGITAGVQGSGELSTATLVDHGLLVIELRSDGQITTADFYLRPPNADPRAMIELGPVSRNETGCISFYASDKTSEGLFPVLCMIENGKVSFIRSTQGPLASRHIYFDSNEAVVGYFGLKKDPDDPRNSIRTLEILRSDD